jgi:biopolymer transport protein ExbD
MNMGPAPGRQPGAMADINVTPMADIMIVLLIIFMVITPMLQKGVDVRLPAAGNTKERKDEPKSIILAVKQDTTTYLNGIKIDSPEQSAKILAAITTPKKQ